MHSKVAEDIHDNYLLLAKELRNKETPNNYNKFGSFCPDKVFSFLDIFCQISVSMFAICCKNPLICSHYNRNNFTRAAFRDTD